MSKEAQLLEAFFDLRRGVNQMTAMLDAAIAVLQEVIKTTAEEAKEADKDLQKED